MFGGAGLQLNPRGVIAQDGRVGVGDGHRLPLQFPAAGQGKPEGYIRPGVVEKGEGQEPLVPQVDAPAQALPFHLQ